MIDSPFEEFVKSLFKTTKGVDTALSELQVIATKIYGKYKPRAEFIRWRDSEEGQSWKQNKYQTQGECCAICKISIQLKGSHIDHIKPLSRFPHLALDTQNMQITCPECNTSKNNKDHVSPKI